VKKFDLQEVSMEQNVLYVMKACVEGSSRGVMTFPEVVGRLTEAGVERYDADLRRREKRFYMPNGEFAVIASIDLSEPIGEQFDANAIAASIHAIQKREILYEEFLRRIMRAGCVSYTVSLTGRRAVYFGRTAESHVELFPPARQGVVE
jgi:uncharacterized protein YbcV (DUF1398 family)